MSKYTIEIQITSDSDDAALKRTEQSLGALAAKQNAAEAAAHKHTAAVGKLHAAMELFSKVALGTAVAAVGFLVKKLTDAIPDTLREERAMRVLADTARDYGQDAEAATQATARLAAAMASKGVDDLEVVEGVTRLISLTRSYEQAVGGAALAADIAAKKNIPYQEALGLVSDLMAGTKRSVVSAHKMFALEATTAQGVLDELREKFGGYAGTLDDSTARMNAFREAWGNLWENFAADVLPGIIEVGTAIEKWITKRLQIATDNIERLRIGAQVRQELAEMERSVVFQSLPSEEQAQERIALVERIWAEGEARITKRHEDAIKERDERERALGVRPRLTTNATTETSEEEKAAAKAAEAAETDRRLRTFAREQRRVDAEIALRKYAEAEKLRVIAEAEGNAEKLRLATFEREQRRVDAKMALANYSAERERDISETTTENDARLGEMRKQQAVDAATSIASSMLSMFGASKEVQVAEALISTYRGVATAIATPPVPNMALGAAALAAGMAQVYAILSTEPGSTGGGSSVGGGGGGASVGSASVSKAAASGPQAASQPAPPVSTVNTIRNENGGNTTVHVNALTGTQAASALRELEHARVAGAKAYRRATVQRRTS